jgi:hypothetical protein
MHTLLYLVFHYQAVCSTLPNAVLARCCATTHSSNSIIVEIEDVFLVCAGLGGGKARDFACNPEHRRLKVTYYSMHLYCMHYVHFHAYTQHLSAEVVYSIGASLHTCQPLCTSSALPSSQQQ